MNKAKKKPFPEKTNINLEQ